MTLAIQGARVAGASCIIAIDPVEMKRQSAEQFGATGTVDPDAGDPDAGDPDAGDPDAGDPDAGDPDAGDPVEQVKPSLAAAASTSRSRRLAPRTADAGARDDPTRRHHRARRRREPCGWSRAPGAADGDGGPLRERQLLRLPRVTRDFPRFIELIESGRVDLGGKVTRHFTLDEVNEALIAMRDGEVVRGVWTMS